MKLIFKIARTELRNLFYSPIAWFLTIAFLVQCALTYTNMLHSYATEQEMGGISLQYMTRLTFQIFDSPWGGLFSNVMQNLYLYIPLLTMGLISREINGGTISLLYSSPVKVREIVLGKYMAMMIYSLVLVAVVSIFMVSGIFNIKSADAGLLWSAVLGFFLLLCAYSAIGLFMSSLTSYQVVAAIGTFIIIGILSYIGRLWQGIDFIRDLTYFLSLNGRTQHMLQGLITTKDVIYFIIIVCMFLGFTIFKLKGSRESKPLSVKIARYAVIIVSVLAIGYLSSRPALIGYLDTTANKDNTLTPNAQKIIHELGDSTLEITAYANFLDNYYYFGEPEERNSYLSKWEPYLRFKPDIKFRYVRYYDSAYANGYNMFSFYKGKTMQQIVEQRAKASDISLSDFKTPEQIHQMIDLKPELNRFVMQLKYRGHSTFLRVFNDQMQWPSETEVSAAFKRLLQAKMPTIAFATGNGERSTEKKGDRAYRTLTYEKTFRYALINQGFDVDTVDLDIQAIPDSITALVIADPITMLSPAAINKIERYIAKGGNLLIAGEPGRQSFINPVIHQLGVQMINGMLKQKSDDYPPSLVQSYMTKTAISFAKILEKPSIDTLPVSMNGVSGLTYVDTIGFNVQPLLETVMGKAYNTFARNPDLDLVDNDSATNNTNSSGLIAVAASGGGMALSVSPSSVGTLKTAGAIKKIQVDTVKRLGVTTVKYTTALALSRKINGKEQRIIVSGDADFMGNLELLRTNPRVSNFYFATALFSWLDNGQFPIDTSRPDSKDNRVRISTDGVGVLKIIYIWVLPALLLLFGSLLLIRRKRK
ncbi:ABC transporter [Arachidicoccus ginsenosidimutans]|uniref:Gldg family protein n=1 Tax=Arachidicoccus sp. BS20 TaxID=1850526 RepID=UPI0007F139D2|nr:Gldg family protein [Arachidicoccus sp. BS20]ANI88974.1 ABC transporter [Arachidicoccus sp. BS20]